MLCLCSPAIGTILSQVGMFSPPFHPEYFIYSQLLVWLFSRRVAPLMGENK